MPASPGHLWPTQSSVCTGDKLEPSICDCEFCRRSCAGSIDINGYKRQFLLTAELAGKEFMAQSLASSAPTASFAPSITSPSKQEALIPPQCPPMRYRQPSAARAAWQAPSLQTHVCLPAADNTRLMSSSAASCAGHSRESEQTPLYKSKQSV